MNMWSHLQPEITPVCPRRPDDAPLAFMHIPKSGGTSLIAALDRALTSGRPNAPHIRGFDTSLFGDFTEFSQLRPSMRKIIRLSAAEYPARPATMLGHFALSTLQAAIPGADLVTFLREPTARLLSQWTYWRSLGWWNTRHWGPAWTGRIKLAALPLAEFLKTPEIACQTDNITTRMLLWPHPLIPADGFIDPANDNAILRLAQSRLRQFSYTDIIERGQDMTDDFVAWLGHAMPRLNLNKTAKSPRRYRTKLNQELSCEALASLARRTRLDERLWLQIASSRGTGPGKIELLRDAARLQAVARCSLLLA